MEKELEKILKEGKENGKKLDHYKMLQEICEYVSDDFTLDVMMQASTGKEITQLEAIEMAHRLGRIYSIAHCITCRACQGKYLKK